MPKPRVYLHSGLYAKSTAVVPAADSPVGQALAERRASLIADLGGRESCSTAQLAMLDLVVAAWWQLDSVTAYLLTLPSLVDKRHRRVWQVVRDRATLATQLQSLLRDIGLERRARDVERDVVAALAASANEPTPTTRRNGRGGGRKKIRGMARAEPLRRSADSSRR